MQSSRDFGFERKGFPQGACALEEAALCPAKARGCLGDQSLSSGLVTGSLYWHVCFLWAMMPAVPPPASRQPRNSFVHWGSELLTLKGHGS